MVRSVVDGGLGNAAAARQLNITAKTVAKWVKHFRAEGVDELLTREIAGPTTPAAVTRSR
jgi:transposase